MAAAADYAKFLRHISRAIGRPKKQLEDSAPEKCETCEEEFTADERKPRFTICCDVGRKAICSCCVNKWCEIERELKKECGAPFKFTSCPYCRRPFETVENEQLLNELQEHLLYDELNKIVEPKGIKCCLCPSVTRKPIVRLVCLDCRGSEVAEWLLSGEKRDRARVKKVSYCLPCGYKHALKHQKKRNERNEFISLSQLIGYSKTQVDAVSDALLKRIKADGYLPRSLCILYALQADAAAEAGGKRIELLTLARLTEVLRETRAGLLTQHEHSEQLAVSIPDFFLFIVHFAIDVRQWSEQILNDPWNLVKDAEWAHSVAELLAAAFEWVAAVVPDVLDDCWDRLSEVIMHQLPSIVKRLGETDDCRQRTMQLLYGTCQLIDKLREQREKEEENEEKRFYVRRSLGSSTTITYSV